MMEPTIRRFAERAARDFPAVPVDPPTTPSLSVVVAGYCYDDSAPRWYLWLVSNVEDLDGLLPEDKLKKGFNTQARYEKVTRSGACGILCCGSGAKAVGANQLESLGELLRQDKPPGVIVDKVVAIVRGAARSPRSQNSVGERCSSLMIPSNRAKTAEARYHSDEVAFVHYSPTYIKSLGDGSGDYMVAETTQEHFGEGGVPVALSIPRVGRNQPCPCRSGKKYKRCHGGPGPGIPQGYVETGSLAFPLPNLGPRESGQ
jgi:SEC-C motif